MPNILPDINNANINQKHSVFPVILYKKTLELKNIIKTAKIYFI